MQTKSLFVIGALLLVPFVYASTSVPDACAAIRDPKYDTGSCTGDKYLKGGQTCCWYQKSYPEQFGRGDKYCQTCTTTDNGQSEKCTEPKKQTIQLPPGSSLQDLPQLQSADNNTLSSNDDSNVKSRTDNTLDNDTTLLTIPKK